MKRLSLVLAVLGVVAVWPAASGAATFRGTVVAKERGKLLVAAPSGLVRAVSGRAVLGSRVAVSGGSATVVGRAKTAHLRGIVIRRLGAIMYISSNHHVVAVRTGVRRLASANGTAPAAGDVVSTDVTIANGELDEDDTSTVGHTSAVEIQAQIVSVGAGTVTLLINGVQVPVSLPAGLTLPASVVGQTVSLKLDLDQQAADDEQGENEDPGDDDGGDDD